MAYAFPPRNASAATRSFHFAKYLPAFGYTVRVVFANKGDDSRPPGPSTRGTRVSRLSQALQRAGILPSYALRWIPDALKQARHALERNSIVTVISTSPPVASHLAALILKRRHKIRWVADFQDPLVGNPFRAKGLTSWLDRLVESWIVRNSDAVVANTDTAMHAFEQRYPHMKGKFSVIWNGYDPDSRVRAAPVDSEDCKIVRHIGNLYGARQPGILLASVERLIAHGSIHPHAVQLEFIGSVDLTRAVWWNQPAARSLRSRGRLIVRGVRVPEAEARRAMASAHGLVLLDINDSNSGLQVPAKLYDYLQVGRPILTFTPRNSPTERILARSGVRHFLIDPHDSNDQADRQVLAFLRESAEVREPSEWFQREFAAPELARRVANLFDQLLGEQDTGMRRLSGSEAAGASSG